MAEPSLEVCDIELTHEVELELDRLLLEEDAKDEAERLVIEERMLKRPRGILAFIFAFLRSKPYFNQIEIEPTPLRIYDSLLDGIKKNVIACIDFIPILESLPLPSEDMQKVLTSNYEWSKVLNEIIETKTYLGKMDEPSKRVPNKLFIAKCMKHFPKDHERWIQALFSFRAFDSINILLEKEYENGLNIGLNEGEWIDGAPGRVRRLMLSQANIIVQKQLKELATVDANSNLKSDTDTATEVDSSSTSSASTPIATSTSTAISTPAEPTPKVSNAEMEQLVAVAMAQLVQDMLDDKEFAVVKLAQANVAKAQAERRSQTNVVQNTVTEPQPTSAPVPSPSPSSVPASTPAPSSVASLPPPTDIPNNVVVDAAAAVAVSAIDPATIADKDKLAHQQSDDDHEVRQHRKAARAAQRQAKEQRAITRRPSTLMQYKRQSTITMLHSAPPPAVAEQTQTIEPKTTDVKPASSSNAPNSVLSTASTEPVSAPASSPAIQAASPASSSSIAAAQPSSPGPLFLRPTSAAKKLVPITSPSSARTKQMIDSHSYEPISPNASKTNSNRTTFAVSSHSQFSQTTPTRLNSRHLPALNDTSTLDRSPSKHIHSDSTYKRGPQSPHQSTHSPHPRPNSSLNQQSTTPRNLPSLSSRPISASKQTPISTNRHTSELYDPDSLRSTPRRSQTKQQQHSAARVYDFSNTTKFSMNELFDEKNENEHPISPVETEHQGIWNTDTSLYVPLTPHGVSIVRSPKHNASLPMSPKSASYSFVIRRLGSGLGAAVWSNLEEKYLAEHHIKLSRAAQREQDEADAERMAFIQEMETKAISARVNRIAAEQAKVQAEALAARIEAERRNRPTTPHSHRSFSSQDDTDEIVDESRLNSVDSSSPSDNDTTQPQQQPESSPKDFPVIHTSDISPTTPDSFSARLSKPLHIETPPPNFYPDDLIVYALNPHSISSWAGLDKNHQMKIEAIIQAEAESEMNSLLYAASIPIPPTPPTPPDPSIQIEQYRIIKGILTNFDTPITKLYQTKTLMSLAECIDPFKPDDEIVSPIPFRELFIPDVQNSSKLANDLVWPLTLQEVIERNPKPHKNNSGIRNATTGRIHRLNEWSSYTLLPPPEPIHWSRLHGHNASAYLSEVKKIRVAKIKTIKQKLANTMQAAARTSNYD